MAKKITTETIALIHEESRGGAMGYAIQYSKANPDYMGNPVYISISGHAPENMIDVLRKRDDLLREVEKANEEISNLRNELAEAKRNNYIYSYKPSKKWFQFWKK